MVVLRPSGNPLTNEASKQMWMSADVISEKSELKSIDTVKVFAAGNAAVATLTMEEKFSYKGSPNHDIARYSMTYEKKDGKWMIVQGHRATGAPPA